MRKNFLPILAIGLIIYGCNVQQKTFDFKTETEKWTKELLTNGEVGNPCREDYNFQKWQEENPNVFFGLHEIKSSKSDFNSDGLFYFSAENCVGSNGMASDFGMLVYSSNGELLTNKNITQTIENGIKTELTKIGINDIDKIHIYYAGLDKTITGEYIVWLGIDGNCCPSQSGTFAYNPTKLTMEIYNTNTSSI